MILDGAWLSAINLFNSHNGPRWDDRRHEIKGSLQSESTLVSADVTQGDDCLAWAYAALAYVV